MLVMTVKLDWVGGRQLILGDIMKISFEEMPLKVSPKLMRMFLQMRMETLLRNKFGDTDAELELEQQFQELGELDAIEGYIFGGDYDYEELFMVITEIEETPGEGVFMRMPCN